MLDVSVLPSVNAGLNGLSALLPSAGYPPSAAGGSRCTGRR